MDIHRWVEQFEINGRNRGEPDWSSPMNLKGKSLEKLRKSIQQFHLGDGGGPAYLIAWNREKILTDPKMKHLVDLWFKEEREHSRLLGEMLTRLGGKPIKSHWSFDLFCGLRKFLGVRLELHALLGTEIVSHVYYKMLRKHGADSALRQMCQLIIRDETHHIAFHRDRLVAENLQHARQPSGLWSALFRLRAVLAGTVLWVNHRGALLALGATDAEFYRWIWRDTSAFIRSVRISHQANG